MLRMARFWRLTTRFDVLTMTTVLPTSFWPMFVKSFSSEMKRGQNSELANCFMLIRSATSSVCPKANATSMAKGSSEVLPTTITSDRPGCVSLIVCATVRNFNAQFE